MTESNITVFERDQEFVVARLREGGIDYVDAISEVAETEFFRVIQAKGYLRDLARPTPCLARKKGPQQNPWATATR